MKYRLDRRVVLSEDSRYNAPYKWRLQELDEEGAKIGIDWMQWDWRLYFTATELSYSDNLTIEPDSRSTDEEWPMVTKWRRKIRAKLRPGDPLEWLRNHQTSYSMFGTNRAITAFELVIEAVTGEEAQDRCTVWGSVSYSFENHFRDETTDDTVIFSLYVQPETFEDYVRMVRSAEVDSTVLDVSGVAGFYSEWSPGITTDSIKVLTNYEKDHGVEAPEGSQIVPRRLGEVDEVSLTFVRKRTIEHPMPERPQDKALVAEEVSANAIVRTAAMLTSLRAAAWVIAALLFLILVT